MISGGVVSGTVGPGGASARPPAADQTHRGRTMLLWNKRKPTESSRSDIAAADSSGVRSADPDRALDAVGTLVKAYGRFAFDTEQAAVNVRQQCEDWAQRIVLGEVRRPNEAEGSGGVLRDWPGLQRFFA